MVTTVLTPVRFRTLDIAVCSARANVTVFPVKFQRRYVFRQQVRKKIEAVRCYRLQANQTIPTKSGSTY